MKTVAFDCKGTLWGGGDKVHKLFKWFEKKGCQMIIWSSVHSYAVEAQKGYGYVAKIQEKQRKIHDEEFHKDNPNYNVDIAVDDDNFIQHNDEIIPTIACNHMILVHEIPEDENLFEELYGHLLK